MSALDRSAEIQAKDDMIRRNKQARAVISLLMAALEDDDPPTDDIASDALGAAQELLNVQ